MSNRRCSQNCEQEKNLNSIDARQAESPGCELEDDRNFNTFAVMMYVSVLPCDGVDDGYLKFSWTA